MADYVSGLSQACSAFVGRPLIALCEEGWGWTRMTEHGDVVATCQGIMNSHVTVIPSAFFSCALRLRGFIGRIREPGCALHGKTMIAYTMSDGDDFNFDTNICPAWRFLFGDGELNLQDENRPSMKGDDVLFGYGTIATSKALIPSCVSV